MNYELFVAKRYLTAKRKQAFISVITFISILGITIGVMALVIAIALITGFQGDVQDKILESTSHIMVPSISGGLKDYPQLISEIENLNGVISATPVAHDNAFLIGPSQHEGVMLKGLDFDLESKYSSWLQELESGKIPEPGVRREGILLGRELAIGLGAGVGDAITVLAASSMSLSPVGLLPRPKRFIVTGIFNTGLYEFDSSMALIRLEAAQKLFNLDDGITYIQVRIEDVFRAPKIAGKIQEIIPPMAYTMTWMELNEALFSALKLEKNIMFLTITLIVLVAALNIIATLILMVMEKTRDIGILMAMGATSRNIRKIFFLQGAMIGVVGTVTGTALGLIWCALANAFELIKIPVDIYQISFVPFHIKIGDLFLIVGITLLISFLSTLFPSHRAAKVDPVIALKYE